MNMRIGRLLPRQSGNFPHRPNFDRSDASPRYPSGDADSLIEILGIDQKVSSELLARLHERTIGHKLFAFAHSDNDSRRSRV